MPVALPENENLGGNQRRMSKNGAKGRRVRRWTLVTVVALLIYPVCGTLVLSTGLFERLVRSEDLVVEVQNPAWTLWPGHVHVAGARILVNGETQFVLSAKHLLLHVNLFQFVKKRLRATKVSADDVRFFMRVQVANDEGIEKRLAAYPPLEGLPGDATLFKKKAEREEKREGDFTVELDGIDVRISELWFMEYHYVGPGALTGGFLVGPNRMRVDTSVQNIGPGEVRFGKDQVVIKDFGGRIEAEIPELNPMEHADESFLELVSSDMNLKGNVTTLAPVAAYANGLTFKNGSGPLEARILLSKGKLGNGSRLTFSTEKIGIRGNGFGLDTDWDLEARVGVADTSSEKALGSADSVLPRIRSKSDLTYVSFSNERRDVFTVQVHDHEHDVVLRTPELGRMTDIDHARIRFPKIVTTDMRDLAAVTSKEAPVESKAGEGTASLTLDIDEHHVVRGPFGAKLNGLRFTTAGILFRAQGDVACEIHADLDKEATTLRNLRIDLSEVGLQMDGQEMEGWWMKAEVPHFAALGFPPRRFEGRLSVLAKSAEPILKVLAGKKEIPGIIPALTKLNDLRIRAKFRSDRAVTDVMLMPLENDLFNVAGRYYSKGDDRKLAIVVGGDVVSLGIAKDSGATTFAPFAREGWLNGKLMQFPKPAEKFRSSEP
jgi:hypothetical protein